jgi:pantothenate synthetase
MSSRNVYLAPADRARAVSLYRALTAAQRALRAGQRSAARLADTMRAALDEGADLDYAAIVDPFTLEPLDVVDGEARALIAARVGSVRLIDNVALNPTATATEPASR